MGILPFIVFQGIVLGLCESCFVLLRVISWIVCPGWERNDSQITRTDTKKKHPAPVLAYKVGDHFIKAGPDKIAGVREDLFSRASQSFEFKQHRLN